MREVVGEHIRIAREEHRPTLVEAFTYRFGGHSAADPEVYRTKAEVEEWRGRDPIETFSDRLREEGIVDEEAIEKMRSEADTTVTAAVEFADASPEPGLDTLYEHLYVLGDEVGGWYAVDERSPGSYPGEHEATSRSPTKRAGLPKQAPRTADPARSRSSHRAPTTTSRRRPRGRGEGEGFLMAALRMRDALNEALREEMQRDESVFLMGEDIGVFEGAFKVTKGLLEEFGEKRVRDTPISENSIVGIGVGAAMAGLRPVIELMTVNFALLAFDQIINHAAAIPYMFNGNVRVPLVIRMPGGAGHQLGPTHSHSFEAMFLQIPGLLVACPSTAADGKGLLKAAIRNDNPVIFIEHETLYGTRGEVPDVDDHVINFGEAAVRRAGRDVTIIGILRMAQVAEKAATTLANEHGIEAEVIDPRTLRPLDMPTIIESVQRTNRVVIVEEGWPHGGVGANLAALITEQTFDYLDAPIQRVTGADVPMPYAKRLEQSAIPHAENVVSAALATMEGVR